MIKLENKTKIATIALILLLTISATLVALPSVNAHDPPQTIETYGFIVAQPNPIGVGQTIYISFWIDKVPPTAAGQWGIRWHNMKLTVTKPDGTTNDLGTFDSDATGGAWTSYVPNEVGEHTFNFEWPGTVFEEDVNPVPYFSYWVMLGRAFLNDTYTPCSASTTLTVQDEPIESAYPVNPFPTEYWQRPINSMNREWYSLGGNWLGLGVSIFGTTGLYDTNNGGSDGGNFNPYTTAPNSAHVLWTKPVAPGGQIGGEFGSTDTGLFATGTAYENKFGAVIINGILYYTQYPGAANNMGPLTAVDLRTGENLWTVNAPNPLRCGMIYNLINGNQYGGHSYIFTAPPERGLGFIVGGTPNVWSMYDAMTGQWILDIANASAGRLVRGEAGELLSYTAGEGMLSLWNISKCIEVASQELLTYTSYSAQEIWRPPQGATIDWNNGYEWSVPIATELNGNPLSLVLSKAVDGVVLLTQEAPTHPGFSQGGWRVDAGYSTVDGQSLWGPINRTLTPWTNVPLGPASEGVYTAYTCQSMTWTGYNLTSGEKLWGPTEPYNSSWGYFDNNAHGVIGYGNLYAWSINGEVYCYDVQTGEQKWSWNTGPAGVDSPYGIWPLGTWYMQHILADGKLYVRSGHDYTPPVFKGAKLYCLNATTGEEIWNSLSFNIISSPACADGTMLWFNGYDNQIYAYGMGPSKTTVTAPDAAVSQGSSVVIRGTVTDESPGTESTLLTALCPNGVPAISDEDQSAWMEYLYQQQPKPEDVTGVDVFVKILDPNGDWYQTTVTTDENGVFSHMWAPAIVGEYHVTAMFEGSKSYYTSQATTAFGVDQAAEGPGYQGPSADEIAQTTVNRLPEYPDVPTADEIAQKTVSQMPAYPEIPEIPEMPEIPEIPAYLTIDLVIIAAVVIAIIIGLYGIVKKQK